MKAITTQYLPDKRRYKAWDHDLHTAFVPAPESDVLEEGVPRGHRLAALALIQKMGWGPCGIQSAGWGSGLFVHVMLPTRKKPFPRFFRSCAKPTSDAVFMRWNSLDDRCVVTADGTVRAVNVEWNWFDMLCVVDLGEAIEITEADAGALLAEVAAGGNPWREP